VRRFHAFADVALFKAAGSARGQVVVLHGGQERVASGGGGGVRSGAVPARLAELRRGGAGRGGAQVRGGGGAERAEGLEGAGGVWADVH
jgi:hypothetical protein